MRPGEIVVHRSASRKERSAHSAIRVEANGDYRRGSVGEKHKHDSEKARSAEDEIRGQRGTGSASNRGRRESEDEGGRSAGDRKRSGDGNGADREGGRREGI